jgi:peptide/nickel transport system permease protein
LIVTRLARRLVVSAATLAGVTVVVFGLVHLAPGDPFGEPEGSPARLPPEALQQLREIYRLDEPIVQRYGHWLADLARGDLGRSFYGRRPVSEMIAERASVTLVLNGLALGVTLLIAVPLGVVAALRPHTAWDRVPALATWWLFGVPTFWAALLLQLLFSVELEWLPLAGLRSPHHDLLGPWQRLADRGAHLVLPVACLSYGGIAYVSRFVRAALLDNAAPDGWRAARARGASFTGTLLRHGFRQAAIPLLTLAGFLLPALVTGSVIVESVFAVPGLGRLFVDAAFTRDLPVILGLTLVSGGATLAGVLAADLACLAVDPRLRDG